MEANKVVSETAAFEQSLANPDKPPYVLRLYITGMTPRSTRAIANIRKICDEFLDKRYDLQVVDVYKQEGTIDEDEIVAVPTLLKTLPLPLRRVIGDLADRERVLIGLN